MTDLLTRLLTLEALQYEYGDPEDRHIWRELQELKQLVQQALAQPNKSGGLQGMNGTGATRCKYCGRPIAGHGHSDQLTIIGGEPFHYQCTLPPSLTPQVVPLSPWVQPHDLRKTPIKPLPIREEDYD